MEHPGTSEKLFLDDLAVGDTFTSAPHQLNADQIRRFAAEFDPQPFHLDETAARASLFQGLAASGWHTVPSRCGCWSTACR